MEKVIHIFDLDDSLLETPTFADFIGANHGENIDLTQYFPEYFAKVKSAFWDELSKEVKFIRMNDFVVPVNTATDKYFDANTLEYFSDKKYRRMFEEKHGVLVLKPFPNFHSNPETIGSIINTPVYKEYVKAENKMILTGRDNKLAELIIQRFNELGIEEPNYGLKTFSPGKLSIVQFKIQTICKSIQEHGWTVVHFYEDRKDWLQDAMTSVNSVFPAVTFHPHLITNIKDKMKLH
jgi:hypothetical protein